MYIVQGTMYTMCTKGYYRNMYIYRNSTMYKVELHSRATIDIDIDTGMYDVPRVLVHMVAAST